jgi:ATP-dependent RNA helicase DDX46/PRP5
VFSSVLSTIRILYDSRAYELTMRATRTCLFQVADFKGNVCNLMIATSVAARGLDVKDLVLVVNYDVPNHYEDYVHRVGRTGRAGVKGTAITFITPEQDKYAPDLLRALTESGRPIPKDLQVPSLLVRERSQEAKGGGMHM